MAEQPDNHTIWNLTREQRKCTVFVAEALCVASAVLFLTTDRAALFSLCAALCLLSCGSIGGCVYTTTP